MLGWTWHQYILYTSTRRCPLGQPVYIVNDSIGRFKSVASQTCHIDFITPVNVNSLGRSCTFYSAKFMANIFLIKPTVQVFKFPLPFNDLDLQQASRTSLQTHRGITCLWNNLLLKFTPCWRPDQGDPIHQIYNQFPKQSMTVKRSLSLTYCSKEKT